jgi:hypothetical protein
MKNLVTEKTLELKIAIEIDFLRTVILPGIETQIIEAHELDRATAYIQGIRKVHQEMTELIFVLQKM